MSENGYTLLRSENPSGTTEYWITNPDVRTGHVKFTEAGRLDIHTGSELITRDGCFINRETFADIQAVLGDKNMVDVPAGSEDAATVERVAAGLAKAVCFSR